MRKPAKNPVTTVIVDRNEGGQTVAAILRAHLSLSWSAARRLVEEGRVRLGHSPLHNAAQRLKAGQRVVVFAAKQAREERRGERPAEHRRASAVPVAAPAPAEKKKYAGPPPFVRHVDKQVVVVDKPAGLTTMRHPEEAAEFGARGQRFLPPTLADLLPELLSSEGKGPRVRAVHRLDRDTSGLVVFALSPAAEANLGKQFRAHSVGRRYLALVRGQARDERIESYLVDDRGDARRGSAREPGEGKHAVTNVRVVEKLGDYTLIECELETGRTHQVRIHLGERGTPLCGEHVYDRPIHGAPMPDHSGAERLALHAATLEFDHPVTGKRLAFQSPLPADMQEVLKRLRKARHGRE